MTEAAGPGDDGSTDARPEPPRRWRSLVEAAESIAAESEPAGPPSHIVRDMILIYLPEAREILQALEDDEREYETLHGREPYFSEYFYATDVLKDALLLPALRDGDVVRVRKCFAAMEESLADDDSLAAEAVHVMILESIHAHPLARRFAGPRMRRAFFSITEDHFWLRGI